MYLSEALTDIHGSFIGTGTVYDWPSVKESTMKHSGHDDVIKWKHFPRYWPFVKEIHRSPANSPPMARIFEGFFYLRLNKRLRKQWWGWWFETPSRSLCKIGHVFDFTSCVPAYVLLIPLLKNALLFYMSHVIVMIIRRISSKFLYLVISGVLCQKQVSMAVTSNFILHRNTVGCNDLSLPYTVGCNNLSLSCNSLLA